MTNPNSTANPHPAPTGPAEKTTEAPPAPDAGAAPHTGGGIVITGNVAQGDMTISINQERR